MRFFGKTTIDFMGKRRLWYVVSATVIGLGMASLIVKGVNYGIDFLGGTEIVVRFQSNVDVGDVRASMDKAGFTKAEINTFGSDRDILIRTPEQGEGNVVGDRIRAGLQAQFSTNTFIVQKEDKIGPKIGAELRRDAIYAVLASLAAILLYLGFRFKFLWAAGAVTALFHDVLLTLGLVSIFDGLIPHLNLEFNQTMVAAFLTLVGLSNNDTVVIFDRIRENQKLFRNTDLVTLINKSVNEVLSRTIITSGTVFIVLAVLLFFGGEVIRGFAFASLVGIVTGTYSSIYIASALVVEVVSRTKSQGKLID
ncbi:MAG TPA: protein translocase subunit SecF [Bacteroidota bacterium]|nr:protein translocase subunit SecF [Bacteroidota bacterium]